MTESTKPVTLMTIHEAAKTGIMPKTPSDVCAGTTKSPACTLEEGRSSTLMFLFPSSTIPTTILRGRR